MLVLVNCDHCYVASGFYYIFIGASAWYMVSDVGFNVFNIRWAGDARLTDVGAY